MKLLITFLGNAMVMINWWQGIVSSDSVCNHSCDWQIGFPFRVHPILLITCMITDQIGLRSSPITIIYKLAVKPYLLIILPF